jgi:hypothetical protein
MQLLVQRGFVHRGTAGVCRLELGLDALFLVADVLVLRLQLRLGHLCFQHRGLFVELKTFLGQVDRVAVDILDLPLEGELRVVGGYLL